MPDVNRTAKITELVQTECRLRLPETQEDCCAVVARVTICVRGYPKDDAELMALSCGMAEGLFGEAWDVASAGQRADWVAMCEDALRDAASL